MENNDKTEKKTPFEFFFFYRQKTNSINDNIKNFNAPRTKFGNLTKLHEEEKARNLNNYIRVLKRIHAKHERLRPRLLIFRRFVLTIIYKDSFKNK